MKIVFLVSVIVLFFGFATAGFTVTKVAPANNGYISKNNPAGASLVYRVDSSYQSASFFCSLYVNNQVKGTNSFSIPSAPGGSMSSTLTWTLGQNGFDITPDDAYAWRVDCTATLPQGIRVSNYTDPSPVIVDNTPPIITISSPANNYVTNNNQMDITFTASDVASRTTACSIYEDNSVIATRSVTNNQQNSVTALGLTSGDHNFYVSCRDDAGNTGRSSTVKVSVATINMVNNQQPQTGPLEITLISPAVDAKIDTVGTTTDVQFSFRPVSRISTTMTCNLKVDGMILQTDSGVGNNTQVSWSKPIPLGQKNWNVECSDSNQIGRSEVRWFTISNPPAVSNQNPLSIQYTSSCTESTVIVTTNGVPVSGSRILVKETGSDLEIYQGDTDQIGAVKFSDCGKRVYIYASKQGYTNASITLELRSCDQCQGGQPPHQNNQTITQCNDDNGCKDNEYCSADKKCVELSGCGEIKDHKMVPFECGELPACNPCANGYRCESNKCVKSETHTIGNENNQNSQPTGDNGISPGRDENGQPQQSANFGNMIIVLGVVILAVIWYFKLRKPVK